MKILLRVLEIAASSGEYRLNRGNFIFLLSRQCGNGRWMRLPLLVETGDSVRDGAGESVGIGEGAIGELMLLQVAPASFDVVQLRGVFRQPYEGEPRARGERLCCQLAGVDWPVVEHRDQGPDTVGGAVGGAKLIEQGNGSRWSAWWRWCAPEGAGVPDQRRRASPAFSPDRAVSGPSPVPS